MCKFILVSLLILGHVITQGQQLSGIASYYHHKFQGKKTASGEIFDQHKLTAAHNKLPLGTFVKVTNTLNQRWIIVKINDRLHAKNKRVIDVSRYGAELLGIIDDGLCKVELQIVSKEEAELYFNHLADQK